MVILLLAMLLQQLLHCFVTQFWTVSINFFEKSDFRNASQHYVNVKLQPLILKPIKCCLDPVLSPQTCVCKHYNIKNTCESLPLHVVSDVSELCCFDIYHRNTDVTPDVCKFNISVFCRNEQYHHKCFLAGLFVLLGRIKLPNVWKKTLWHYCEELSPSCDIYDILTSAPKLKTETSAFSDV